MSVLSKVNAQLSNKLPFVLYALPNSKKVCALLQTNDTVYQFKEQDGFIIASFNSKEVLVIPNDASVFIEEDFKSNAIQFEPLEISFNEIEKQNFEQIVTLAIKQIKESFFEKVVLSRSIVVETDVDCVDSFCKMVQRYPTAFCYVYYHPKIGCWMGATPEQLLKVTNHNFETVALAGTQKKADFIDWSAKEKHEQQVVTDYILECLHEEVLTLKVAEPTTVEAGELVHLKTTITGNVYSDENIKTILNQLNPTPAVCGFPKESALEFILKNENYDREFYTGYLGLWDTTTSTANLFVNLRCMKIEDGKSIIYVGCGITADSNPEKEFFETEHKSMTMRTIL